MQQRATSSKMNSGDRLFVTLMRRSASWASIQRELSPEANLLFAVDRAVCARLCIAAKSVPAAVLLERRVVVVLVVVVVVVVVLFLLRAYVVAAQHLCLVGMDSEKSLHGVEDLVALRLRVRRVLADVVKQVFRAENAAEVVVAGVRDVFVRVRRARQQRVQLLHATVQVLTPRACIIGRARSAVLVLARAF